MAIREGNFDLAIVFILERVFYCFTIFSIPISVQIILKNTMTFLFSVLLLRLQTTK